MLLLIHNSKDLAKNIRFLRKTAGLSQLDLAGRAGISRTALQNLESGKETVQLSSLFPVLAILNIKLCLDHSLLKNAIAGHEEGDV